jgi:hypothetical protein
MPALLMPCAQVNINGLIATLPWRLISPSVESSASPAKTDKWITGHAASPF